MVEKNDDTIVDSIIDEFYGRFSPDIPKWKLKLYHRTRLNEQQKEELTKRLRATVEELEPEGVIDLEQGNEVERFLWGIECCWFNQLKLTAEFQENYSSFTVRKKAKNLQNAAQKMRDAFSDFEDISVILKIIPDEDLLVAFGLILEHIDKFIKEFKPKKGKPVTRWRDFITIPHLTKIYTWYLGNPYLGSKSGREKWHLEVLDSLCDLVGFTLTFLGISTPNAGDSSMGESEQGRLRIIIKKVLKDFDKGHSPDLEYIREKFKERL